MKILMVIDQYYSANNGMTISARRFADVLRSHGHEVRVLCGVRHKSDCPEQDRENAYLLKKVHVPFFDWLISSQGMLFARPDKKIIQEALDWADVVHFLNSFHMERVVMKMCRKQNKPFTGAFHVQPENITSTEGLGDAKWINDFIYNAYRKHFYQYCRHIHCPSNFIAQQLRAHGYESRLHVISNGIDPDFVYRKLPKEPSYGGKYIILMVGRYSIEKMQNILIEGVAQSKHADNIQLILAGQGPRRKKLKKLSEKLLPNPAIMKFYTKAELMDVIAQTDLYVHAAHVEIEAMSCMEAFASGLVPVIADSKKSATPQFAIDERSLFRDEDPSDLAKKIDYWYEHPKEKEEMEHRYAELGKVYQLDACVKRCEKMFEAELEEHNAMNR